jgi:tRNA A-37 threonylcarbamoyl transferase component Bud32
MVLLAEDTVLERRVAIKVMRPHLAADPPARERFLREGRAAAALKHGRVIEIYHVGEQDGVPFLVMPLLEGESLAERLKREGALAIGEVLRIGREAAEGLAAAHAKGLVHRDIKPANLWLEARSGEPGVSSPTGGGQVKVLDFGLVHRAGGDQLTAPGAVMGTAAYMAPEQVQGTRVDGRCDLFSLGVVLYEMSTGERPFKGADTLALLAALALDEPVPAQRLRPDLPAELAGLIGRMLAKSPQERPASAREVAEALRTLEAGRAGDRTASLPGALGAGSVPLPGAAQGKAEPGRRRVAPILALTAAGLVFGVVALGAALGWRNSPGKAGPETEEERGQARGKGGAAKEEEKMPPLRIRPLRVDYYRTVGQESEPGGRIGETASRTHYGDAVTLRVDLSVPGYCYVLAFNFDGKEELLWPVDEQGKPSERLAPPRSQQVRFPASGRLYLEEDTARSGLQAYVVAASARPLPPFGQWRKGRAGLRWKRLPAGKTVWEADARGVYPVSGGLRPDRGKVRPVPGEPPLADLCRAARAGGVEVVEAIAFPVLPKEGE